MPDEWGNLEYDASEVENFDPMSYDADFLLNFRQSMFRIDVVFTFSFLNIIVNFLMVLESL